MAHDIEAGDDVCVAVGKRQYSSNGIPSHLRKMVLEVVQVDDGGVYVIDPDLTRDRLIWLAAHVVRKKTRSPGQIKMDEAFQKWQAANEEYMATLRSCVSKNDYQLLLANRWNAPWSEHVIRAITEQDKQQGWEP